VEPPLDYTVKRSDHARRVRVTVKPDGEVMVTLPQRASAKRAQEAVVELRPWIDRRLGEVAATQAALAARNGTVPYLGETLTLRPEAGRQRVRRAGDTLLVPRDPQQRADALERWYRGQARAEIAPLLDEAAAKLGTSYTKLTIRAQRTRWGSCSATGALAFNWRLLLAPPDVLAYVVWHEACHLVHLDHSPRFWGLLEHHLPGYRAPKRWLRRHGATLVL